MAPYKPSNNDPGQTGWHSNVPDNHQSTCYERYALPYQETPDAINKGPYEIQTNLEYIEFSDENWIGGIQYNLDKGYTARGTANSGTATVWFHPEWRISTWDYPKHPNIFGPNYYRYREDSKNGQYTGPWEPKR